jgi:VRR-NUC domain
MIARRPEQGIQRAVFEHLAWRRAPGVFAFHPANGGWRSRTEAAILRGLGVVAGVPDVILVRNGKAYALELKAPGGRLSDAQRQAHDALRAAGAEVATAVGLDDAVAQLEGWGLLRGRADLRPAPPIRSSTPGRDGETAAGRP